MHQSLLIVAILILGVFLYRSEKNLRRMRAEKKTDQSSPPVLPENKTDSNQTPNQPARDPSFRDTMLIHSVAASMSGEDAFLENTLKATRDGLWDWDRRTDRLHFNSRFLDMLGYSPDSFPREQDTWIKLLHPDERDDVIARQQKILDSPEYGDEFEHIFRLRSVDGSYRWFMGRILNIRRDADGRAIRVVGANVDISDIKELRDKESKASQLQQALTSTSDGVWEWVVPEDALQDKNCFFTMLGRTDDGLTTGFSAWEKRIHPEDRDLAVNIQLRIMASPENGDGAECTYRYMNTDGQYRWMLGRTNIIQRDDKGQALRVVGVHTDITELKSIRSELELRNERLNYAFAAARDGLWDLDVSTNEVYYSPRYISMLGYTPGDIPSTQTFWENGIHPDDRDQVIAHQLKHFQSPDLGDALEQTYRFKASDGTYRWILARALVVSRGASGKALRVVGLHTDVTEMRRTQESLRILLQHDSLTGLYSRSYFETQLSLLQDGKYDPVSLIVCDLDGLKLVNDHLGHTEGDHLLIRAAAILNSVTRRGDIVARIGGDEMVVLLPSCSHEMATGIMERLSVALESYHQFPDHLPVSISTGLASMNMLESNPTQLFREADGAMRENKNAVRQHRRNQIKLWIENRLGHPLECELDDRTC